MSTKKVYVQIVDSNGTYQFGMISEPIKSGLEVNNALIHFIGQPSEIEFTLNTYEFKSGVIKGTTKKFTAIII